MKRILIVSLLLLCAAPLLANHITGGEIFYTYTGRTGSGSYQYRVTLKLYRDHFSTGAALDASASMAIFDAGTNAIVWSDKIPITRQVRLRLGFPGPCISNAPAVDYDVGYYEFNITLPGIAAGYIISYQRCCRIAGINNLLSSSNVGTTYTAIIPGNQFVANGPENNSAQFVGADTVIVCAGYNFNYSFAARDVDPGDQLTYTFCGAFTGGGQSQGTGPNSAAPSPPAAPPYSSVPYSGGFNSSAPLQSNVLINPSTGMITGIAPPAGIYVVTVCVNEVRNGVVIATQRKDLQIKSGDCDLPKATLPPQILSCDDYTVTFTNLSNSPLVNSYTWSFGDPASGANNQSNASAPVHTFSGPGDYTVKVITNAGQQCSDSTTATVKVWPGFQAAFSSEGVCLWKPVQFTDESTTSFGTINSWTWDFGESPFDEDMAFTKDVSYNFLSAGPKQVSLIVTSSKGCIDSVKHVLQIIDKPPIHLAFRDTLICTPDALQLQASGTGQFSWTPGMNIINANTGTPTVNPPVTTTYHVMLDEQGCVNTDSVRVRVVDFVTLHVMPDTTICATDAVQLSIQSDGLKYQWTPAAAVSNAAISNPLAIGGVTTTYIVTATIGSCSATKGIKITAVPYPKAYAGTDTIICYNQPAFLYGEHDGNRFEWSPAGSLENPGVLHAIAHPARTTAYVLSSWDNRGCPKPGRDTVLVKVMPRIFPYAGHDTLVVAGQPLQLQASGGNHYQWTPATGLNDPLIANPVGIYAAEIDSVRYKVYVYDSLGCLDSTQVKVTVFKTNPSVFVPTGFTPNGDGLNDVLKPITVGIKQFHYFAVYNRWGQLVYRTTTDGYGWDGRIGGVIQNTNVYAWMVSATDYLGQPVFLKGTTTLVR